jgi:hypothetical protein
MFLILLGLVATAATAQTDQMPYEDSDFACISQTKAQQFTRDFNIDTGSFGGMELCRSSVDTKKLFNDLQILEDGQFSTQGSNNLIRGFVDADKYYEWMREETRGIERGNDIPTATAYNSMGYFTMQDGWAALSTLGRVGTVVHEARHTAGYRHYTCRQGSYEGSSLSGCDESYNQGGSHAVEMEYYARVSVQGENFHPVYKSMARLMAMARANFVFNSPILRKREAIVAVSHDTAYLFDNGQWFEREIPAIPGTLKRTSAGAVFFNGSSAYAIEMYGKTGTQSSIRDDYSYFKLLTMPGSSAFKNMEELDLGTRRFLVGVSSDNKVGSYVFAQGQWSSFQGTNMNVAKTATTLENGETGLFLVSDTGDIFPYDPLAKRLGSRKSFKWTQGIQSVAKLGNQTLMLNESGRIFENKNGQWEPWAPADGQPFSGTLSQMVSVPLYDAFEVVK